MMLQFHLRSRLREEGGGEGREKGRSIDLMLGRGRLQRGSGGRSFV